MRSVATSPGRRVAAARHPHRRAPTAASGRGGCDGRLRPSLSPDWWRSAWRSGRATIVVPAFRASRQVRTPKIRRIRPRPLVSQTLNKRRLPRFFLRAKPTRRCQTPPRITKNPSLRRPPARLLSVVRPVRPGEALKATSPPARYSRPPGIPSTSMRTPADRYLLPSMMRRSLPTRRSSRRPIRGRPLSRCRATRSSGRFNEAIRLKRLRSRPGRRLKRSWRSTVSKTPTPS